ncbi:hypothetical protein [Reyranella sp.]|uniref:hypothetical protein n=1 Tax=Reyranella sp. TaxID=1929291 RepID=UPI0037839637
MARTSLCQSLRALGRATCAITASEGQGPFSVVLLIHGGGATHAMMLDQYPPFVERIVSDQIAFLRRHLSEGRDPD